MTILLTLALSAVFIALGVMIARELHGIRTPLSRFIATFPLRRRPAPKRRASRADRRAGAL